MKQERKEVIAVNGLTKRFGTIAIVDNISFSVPNGEIFGFSAQTEPEKRQRSGCSRTCSR
ncbi:MAG: hypothetical protein ACXW02_06280 [Halobacteriota archaeon]